jgi:hypothetical protein
MKSLETLKKNFGSLKHTFTEQSLRIWAATEAKSIGHGGTRLLSEVSGLSEKTIKRGLDEINKKGRRENLDLKESGEKRVRKIGGGRKKITETDPNLKSELEKLISPFTRGDPESSLRWSSKSYYNLAEELTKNGHAVSAMTIYNMLTKMEYTLQSNKKTKEGASHEDRDAQFQYINTTAEEFHKKNSPVVSIDAKKKELIGEYKNNGRELLPKKSPTKVNGHDFPDKNLGKVTPYGVYDIFRNEGWVNVGISSDTAEFAVASIKTWWVNMGKQSYPNATELFVTADCGGSNGYRTRLWKRELQNLANEIKLKITVSHFPPGTSKWNKIEHKMFSFISINWRGKPLISREVVVNLIGSTKTKSGLTVRAGLDEKNYEKGLKIEDEEMENLNIEKNNFHGEWNYTIVQKKF